MTADVVTQTEENKKGKPRTLERIIEKYPAIANPVAVGTAGFITSAFTILPGFMAIRNAWQCVENACQAGVVSSALGEFGEPFTQEYLLWNITHAAIIGASAVAITYVVNRRHAIDIKKVEGEKTNFQMLLNSLMEGAAHCRMIYDNQGNPVDFEYLGVNPAFETLTGLHDVVGRKVTQVILGIRESNPEMFEIYNQVTESGKNEKFDIDIGSLEKSLSIKVSRVKKGEFFALFEDITEQKKANLEMLMMQERLKTITDTAKDGIVEMNQEGSVTFWNPAAENIFGYTRDETLGQNIHEIIIPKPYIEMHKAALPAFSQAGQGNLIGQTVEFTGVRKDGSERDISLSLSSVQREGQWYAVGIIRDVTEYNRLQKEERKRAEEKTEKLQRQNEAYINTLMKLPVPAYMTTEQGEIIMGNPALENLLGYTIDEMRGLPVEATYNNPAERRPFLANLMQNGATKAVHELKKKDGAVVTVIDEAQLNKKTGVITGFMTEVKKLSGDDIVSICASCKSIREGTQDNPNWVSIEKYLSDINFSHGICQPCAKKLYPGYM